MLFDDVLQCAIFFSLSMFFIQGSIFFFFCYKSWLANTNRSRYSCSLFMYLYSVTESTRHQFYYFCIEETYKILKLARNRRNPSQEIENSTVEGRSQLVGNSQLSRADCAICLRSCSVTSVGLIRAHGPVASRCSGSHQPAVPAVPIGSDTAASDPVLSTSNPLLNTTSSDPTPIQISVPQVKIIKRIPRASREQALSKLANILEGVVNNNSPSSWERLFLFSTRCLRVPSRSDRRWSLATMINKQLREEDY